ncbi:unnamed protein product [Linum trigynum]
MFIPRSQSLILGLKDKPSTFTRGILSLRAYLCDIKLLTGELALVGALVDDLDLVPHTLNGLSTEFKEIDVVVRARDTPPSFEELFDKLLSHDEFLQRQAAQSSSPLVNATTRQGRSP